MMFVQRTSFFLVVVTFIDCTIDARLSDIFHNFQIITPKHLRVRTTRSLNKSTQLKTMSFSILGQDIVLKLKPKSLANILLPGGRIQARHANGSLSNVQLDPDDFHVGIIQGHPGSRVHSVKYGSMWLVHSTYPPDPNLSFSIEPLSFHIDTSTGHDSSPNVFKMVAFRHHDIKQLHNSRFSSQDNTIPSGKTHQQQNLRKRFRTKHLKSLLKFESVHSKSSPVFLKHKQKNKSLNRSSYSLRDFIGKKATYFQKFNSEEPNIPKDPQGGLPSRGDHSRRLGGTGFRKNEENSRTKMKGDYRWRWQEKGGRTKRNSEPGDICDILSIIDYTFFKTVGHKSTENTAKYMFLVFTLANDIFVETHFTHNGMNQTAKVKIHAMEILTDEKLDNGFPHYVLYGTNGDDILKEMTNTPYFNQYCLIHLSTARDLSEQTLGVAAIASADGYKRIEGICGGQAGQQNNVGLSTVTTTVGRQSHVRAYTLIVAHELGHNFGGRHDDGSISECAPSETEGGKYIMWWQSTSGRFPNNDKFSICSRKRIAHVLAERKWCLMTEEMLKASHCGNGRLDYGEDCDSGRPYLSKEKESCCSLKCRFSTGATCSPFNHPCCENCTVARKGRKCTTYDQYPCDRVGRCDGINHDSCQSMGSLPNGHACGHKGQCQSGKCVSYCRIYGNKMKPPRALEPCICRDTLKHMCSICCRKVSILGNASCQPSDAIYPDNTECPRGKCSKGICKPSHPVFKTVEIGNQKFLNLFGFTNIALMACLLLMFLVICLYIVASVIFLREAT